MNNSHSPKSARMRLNPRKKPAQSRAVQTVEVILEGAAHILEERGLEGYTTNDIAARAGVSIGSLYQYFPTKDAVTLSLIQRESAALAEDINAAFDTEDPKKALRAMIAAAVRHQLRRPRLARLLDFEEDRLAALMPASSNAAAVRARIIAFLQKGYGFAGLRVQGCGPRRNGNGQGPDRRSRSPGGNRWRPIGRAYRGSGGWLSERPAWPAFPHCVDGD